MHSHIPFYTVCMRSQSLCYYLETNKKIRCFISISFTFILYYKLTLKFCPFVCPLSYADENLAFRLCIDGMLLCDMRYVCTLYRDDVELESGEKEKKH